MDWKEMDLMAYIKLNDGTIKQVDDDEFKALIMAKAGEETDAPPSQGYNYTSPDDYTDLYNNAKMVGYSGLDDAQKALFDKAYPSSKAAQSGMSLEDARAATDAGAEYQTKPAAIGQGYNNAYDKLGAIDITNSNLPIATKAAEYARVPGAMLAADIASFLSGIQGVYANRDLGLKGAISAGWDAALDQAVPSYNKAVLGLDGEGIVADPANFSPFGTIGKGLGAVGKLVSKLPIADKIASYVGGHTLPAILSNVAKPAMYGAGYGAASDIANPNIQVEPSQLGHDALTSGLIGGGLGIAGEGLKRYGVYNIPGRDKYASQLAKLNVPNPREAARTNIANLLDQTSFPISQDKLANQIEANRVSAGQRMNDALDEVDRKLPYNQPEYTSYPDHDVAAELNIIPVSSAETPNVITAMPDIINTYGQYVQKSWPHNNLPGVEINNPESKWFIGKTDWEDIAKNAHENHNREQSIIPTQTNEKKVHKAIDEKIDNLKAKISYTEPYIREGEFKSHTINPDQTVTPDPLSRVDKVSSLARMKHAVTSQYVPRTNKEIVNREADDAIHEAIENRLEQIPGYKEKAAQAKKDYAIAKGLGQYMQEAVGISNKNEGRNRTGLNTYGLTGNMYKVGQLLQNQHNIGIANGLRGIGYTGYINNYKKK